MLQKDRTINYYKYCDEDYRWLWRDNKSLATHLGFWGKNTKTHSQSLINQNEMMAKIVKINKKDIILDAGCCVGGSAFWLAQNFQTKIAAINISENQLELAKSYSKKRNKNNLITFSKRNYYETQFPSQSFSIVWAQESLPHAEDKFKFLKEAHRILKKGGRLIISNYFLGKEAIGDEKEVFDSWINSWCMTSFLKPEEFIQLAKKAGFKKVRFIDTTSLIEKSLAHMKRTMYLVYLPALIFELITRRNIFQKENRRSPIYAYRSYKMNLWKHGIIYAEKP